MHLVELLSLRPEPAAGISLALTRRCPLSCAHCATNSTLSSEQAPAEMFVRFVDTFTPELHPDVLAISGGEAFLRPRLLQEVAERARRAGTRTCALSGMFWANQPRIPKAIERAIDALDHFSASVDVFHEQEVPRRNVFRALDTLLADGHDVSLHIVGLDTDDPYLAEITEEVCRVFGEQVPMLVNGVTARGRAAQWLEGAAPDLGHQIEPDPCTLAAWPVVAYDGTVVACGNDDVVEGPAPPHLVLGHAQVDGWPVIRSRCLTSSVVRAVRTFGPEYVNERYGSGAVTCDGMCSTCQNLSRDVTLEAQLDEVMNRRPMAALERQVVDLQHETGAESFIRRFALPRYADLISLGAPI